MKFQKTLLTSLFFAISTVHAVDTTVITKATVKLIKQQRLLSEEIKKIKASIEKEDGSSSGKGRMNAALIRARSASAKVKRLSIDVESNKEKIDQNANFIDNLFTRLTKLEAQVAQNTKEIQALKACSSSRIVEIPAQEAVITQKTVLPSKIDMEINNFISD